MGLLEKITGLWRRGSPEPTLQTEQAVRPDSTPLTHSSESVDETTYLYQQLQVESNRRAVLRDIERMLEDDPLIDETNDRVARKVVRGGIFVTVSGSGKHQQSRAKRSGKKAGRGAKAANQAQQVIEDFWKRCKIDAIAKMWVSRLIADGDLFLNVVIEDGDGQPRIGAIRWTPPMIMKRNEDQFGQFIDLDRAFSEIDPLRGTYFATIIPDDAVRHFPLWAINHVRYKWRGGMYGRSQYASIRKLSRQNATADDDMVVRRKTRAPMRRVHAIGNKDNPGDPTMVDKYRMEHKDAIVNGRYAPTTDYYHNGFGSVTNLDGDGNLDKIADVKYLYDKQNTGTIVPKGLVGHAEDINRDVLDDQKKEYDETVEDIRTLIEYGDGGPFSGLRAIVDLELLLHGIDVDALGLTYDMRFGPLQEQNIMEAVEATASAKREGLISSRTATLEVAHHFGVEDPDEEIEAIALERASNPQAAPKEESGDPEEDTDPVEDHREVDHIHDEQVVGEEPEHLQGMDSIEQEAKETWQERFLRIEKEILDLDLPVPREVAVTDEDGSDKVYYLSKEQIDAFIDQVASIQKADGEKYRVELGYVLLQSAEVGGQYAAGQTGLNFRLYRKDVQDDLTKQAGERIKNIDQTTLNHLRVALGEGFLSGSKREMITQVRQAISGVMEEAAHARSEVIARTESMWAYNRSALRVYSAAGVDVSKAPPLPAHPRCRCAYAEEDGKIIILVTGDERTCPKCRGYIGKSY